ncbi:MAG TPA: divergent PAP2 family protein [Anaerolineales bacterium]|nr:divergent PAP2 family protein [Anaerolineales bacterium]
MPNFLAIFQNQPLVAAAIAWAVAQILKLPFHYLVHKEWKIELLYNASGMPSSHSAIVTALTWMIGLQQGWDSPVFAVAFILTTIVLYDAAGVRRAAGEQAQILNHIIDELAQGHPLKEKELKELLGHTPSQVLGGLICGIVVAQCWYWFIT